MAREVVFTGEQISRQPQALYHKALVEFGDKYDLDIITTICHGRYEHVPVEMSFDKLYIFVQLLPKEFEGVARAKVSGYKCNGQELIFPVKEDEKDPSKSPCPQGDTLTFTKSPKRSMIIIDDNGVPMAVVMDGSLYFLNDFIHSRSMKDFEVGIIELQYVLDKAVAAGLIDQVKGGLEEKSKRSLETAMRQQFTIRLEKEIVQQKATRDIITKYEQGISESTRKLFSIDKIIDAIRTNIEDVDGALTKTWKNLVKIANSKLYTNISYTKSGIKATTTPIFIEWQGKQYDAGRYEVTLFYDGTSKIHALDRRIENKYDHPHITDGLVCWGNFSGTIPKLIGSSEFDVALDMIYTFLCHYDSGNPYKNIDYWPVVQEKPKEVKKAAVVQELEVRI